MQHRILSRTFRVLPLAIAAALFAACDDDPSGPNIDRTLVVGTYTLQTLTFDPQGSLAAVDLGARIGVVPELNLSSSGGAQVAYRDPVTNLVRTIDGTFRTTETGVRIDFDAEAAASLLMPERLELEYDGAAGTLSFSGQPGDGVSRTRLLLFVPEWAEEQLLDPVPGVLTVVFVR